MSIEYRKYFGKKFYKQKNGYWCNMMPIQAHRWVWINHYGSIPEGMDIHHKDGDKGNNEIENLEMLSRSDHLKEHWKCPKLRKERREFLDQIRPQVHAWLRSDEGKKIQSEASKKAWKERKFTEVSCIKCDKKFLSRQPWAKFCGEKCGRYWRISQKLFYIDEKCPICHNLFQKNKFSPQQFCSISCGAKNSSKNRKKLVN